jgi:hypothetical protein
LTFASDLIDFHAPVGTMVEVHRDGTGALANQIVQLRQTCGRSRDVADRVQRDSFVDDRYSRVDFIEAHSMPKMPPLGSSITALGVGANLYNSKSINGAAKTSSRLEVLPGRS